LRGYSVHPDLPDYKSMLRRITKASNEVLFEVVEDLVHSFVEDRSAILKARFAGTMPEFCRGAFAKRGAFVFQRQRFFLQELGEGASVSQLICSAPGVVAAKSHFTYLGCSPLLQGS
jgi:hypothetical protein